MNVNNFDLNLLLVFEAMYFERNVTRAALRIGLTQPAASNALSRLRDLLDDPLFVRSAQGMVPTPRALALGPIIETALANLREGLKVKAFEPERSIVSYRISTLDYLEAAYLPGVIDTLAHAGPGLSLRVHRLESIFGSPKAALDSGNIDCALGIFPLPLPPQDMLHSQLLGWQDDVCIARKGHPALLRQLTLDSFAGLQHLGVSYPTSETSGQIDQQLASHGHARVCPATVPHFLTLPFHVAASDCVGVLPRSLALHFGKMLDLQIAELPPFLPPLAISLVWAQRLDRDPAHVWFRDMVANTLSTRISQDKPVTPNARCAAKKPSAA